MIARFGQRADLGEVAEPSADLQAPFIPLARIVEAAHLRRDGAGDVEGLSETGFVISGFEASSRRVEVRGRRLELALLAGELGECGVRPTFRVDVADGLGRRQRLVRRGLGARPLTDQLEHLAEVEQRVDALAPVEERDQALVVVDRGRIRVAGLGGGRRGGQVEPLLRVVVAVPVVVGEQVEGPLDRVIATGLEVLADPSMERRAQGERQVSTRRSA